MTNTEASSTVVPAPHGWRRAYLHIDWADCSVRVEWHPIIAFAIGSEDDDLPLCGAPIMTEEAPDNEGFEKRYEALMDPGGVVTWRGEVFNNSAQWFDAWCAEGGCEYSMVEYGATGPVRAVPAADAIDPSIFRPRATAKPTKARTDGKPLMARKTPRASC